MEVLKSIQYVDLVCVFNENTPLKLIDIIKPDILFKGGDYKNKALIGEEIVKKKSGEIKLINLFKNYNTTSIIKKMREK